MFLDSVTGFSMWFFLCGRHDVCSWCPSRPDPCLIAVSVHLSRFLSFFVTCLACSPSPFPSCLFFFCFFQALGIVVHVNINLNGGWPIKRRPHGDHDCINYVLGGRCFDGEWPRFPAIWAGMPWDVSVHIGFLDEHFRCVQVAGYFCTKFLRFPRLAAQSCYIYSVNTRKCPLMPVNAR